MRAAGFEGVVPVADAALSRNKWFHCKLLDKKKGLGGGLGVGGGLQGRKCCVPDPAISGRTPVDLAVQAHAVQRVHPLTQVTCSPRLKAYSLGRQLKDWISPALSMRENKRPLGDSKMYVIFSYMCSNSKWGVS